MPITYNKREEKPLLDFGLSTANGPLKRLYSEIQSDGGYKRDLSNSLA